MLRWIQLGRTSKVSGVASCLTDSGVQTSITSLWNPSAGVLMEDIIPGALLDYIPRHKSINHKDAVGALDATLIMIPKPMDKEENNVHFSGKHKEHGVKLQVLAAPDDFCIHFGEIIPGKRNDFYLYNCSGLSRVTEHSTVEMDGIKAAYRPLILADCGYMRIQNSCPRQLSSNVGHQMSTSQRTKGV